MVAGSADTAEGCGAGGAGQRFIPVDDPGAGLDQQPFEFLTLREIRPHASP